MPDVHIVRHGDRWAVSDSPGATPFFESYTREEAEAEARRHAGDDGEIRWAGDESGETAVGQDDTAAPDDRADREATPPDELSPSGAPETPAEGIRKTQGGF